jgi:hypothetical protein
MVMRGYLGMRNNETHRGEWAVTSVVGRCSRGALFLILLRVTADVNGGEIYPSCYLTNKGIQCLGLT